MPDRVPSDAIGAVFILMLHRFKSAVLVAESQVNPCERVRGDIAPFGEILQFLDQPFGVPSAASHRVCRPQDTEKRRRTLISGGRSFENLDGLRVFCPCTYTPGQAAIGPTDGRDPAVIPECGAFAAMDWV